MRDLERPNGTLMAPRLCSEIIPAAGERRKTVSVPLRAVQRLEQQGLQHSSSGWGLVSAVIFHAYRLCPGAAQKCQHKAGVEGTLALSPFHNHFSAAPITAMPLKLASRGV